MTTTRRVFTFDDGSQVLIETWTSGDLEHQTAAYRRYRSGTWGPPVNLDYADDDKPPTSPVLGRLIEGLD